MGSKCGICSIARNRGRDKAEPGDGFPSSLATPEHGVGKGMVRTTHLVTNAEKLENRSKMSIDHP